MQYGLVKYDQWEDLVWVYNSIGSYIRTPLTGVLVGINAENKELKYVNCISASLDGYGQPEHHEFNPYCGCHFSGINALQPHEMGLVIATGRGVDMLNRDGGRRMRVMSEKAERQVTREGANHIACSLLECGKGNSRILLTANSDELYALDAFHGQLYGKMKMINDHVDSVEFSDQITSLADMNGNASRSSCMMSYYHTYPENTDFANEQFQSLEYTSSSEALGKRESSLENIARGFGSIDAIPEFIPASKGGSVPTGTMKMIKMSHQKTSGAISLEYAMQSQKEDHQSYFSSRHITCVGMLSGRLHIVDHRMQKIAYTVAAHTNAVSSISAYGNDIVTTGCYLYGQSLMYEPFVELHDIRMEKSRSVWFASPVLTAKLVKEGNQIVALKQDGSFSTYGINDQNHVHHPNIGNESSWDFHDVDIKIKKGVYAVYTADEAYSLGSVEVENKACFKADITTETIKPIFKKIKPEKNIPQNTTMFASLMGTFPGDVAQVFVQVFFFLSKLSSLRYHCCEVEHCLACQVGFSLHMLHVAHENRKMGYIEEGADSRIAKSSAMQITLLQELMPVDMSETNALAVQRLLIWFIEKINSELDNHYSRLEGEEASGYNHLIKNVFGFSKHVEARCINGHDSTKVVENELFMDYKHLQPGQSYEEEMVSFCVECSKHVNTHYKIDFMGSPNFMIVRCEQEEISHIKERIVFDSEGYKIVTVIFSVPDEDMNKRLFAYVRVPREMRGDQEWLLINEGYVCVLSEEDINEMFNFTPLWKQAITLIYRKDNIGKIIPISPTVSGEVPVANVHGRIVPLPPPDHKMPISTSIFTSEYNIAHNPRAHDKHRTFVPLSVEELVGIRKEQFIVALDVECVKTGNETTNSNIHLNLLDTMSTDYGTGTIPQRNTFIYSNKYSEDQQLSTLARVSAVRGTGDATGVPFLDHYIHRRKPPKDYLTRFSGIHQGDLDLKSSVHWLTTRKAIYMKIRYLIDAGCVILGHGLDQDFKMLNIVVPKEQVIDTVELFRLPGKRYLSLQFLAAHLLNRRIQQDEHDSVEDAKTALDLYRKYQEYSTNGQLDHVLRSLYDIGYKTNWVVN